MKWVRKILLGFLIIAILGATIIWYLSWKDTLVPYDVTLMDSTVIPRFRQIPLGFSHIYDKTNSLPTVASACIDIDGDLADEVFLGGGFGQPDVIFRFANDSFIDISTEAGLLPQKETATLAAVSFDMDQDGDSDLLISRPEGSFFYENKEGTFLPTKLDIPFNEKSTPGTFTLGDFDQDGTVDLFISNYIRKELIEGYTIFTDTTYGATSILLLNNGDLTFRDVTTEWGMDYVHNTFQAIAIDIDIDGWLDLVVAYDTGEARTYKNIMGKRFQLFPNPTSGKYAYPMGIAVGDHNDDSKPDFFFSNTGSTIAEFLAKGDLNDTEKLNTKWILFENEGNFKFVDVAEEVKVADYEFSWGCIFTDFNLDGRQDLLVAENYADFPLHQICKLPGRLLLQQSDRTYYAAEEEAGVANKYFGIAPLVSDFNEDGYPDVIHVNIAGPSMAFLSIPGKNNFLKVKLPENAETLGAIVSVTTTSGRVLTDYAIVGEGLAGDQSNILTFGLDQEDVRNLKILYPTTGRTSNLSGITSNQTVIIE